MLKPSLFLFSFPLALFLGAVPFVAFGVEVQLIAPENTLNPPINKSQSSFQWCEVSGAVKYILDIDRFDESIDNLSPEKCKAPRPNIDSFDCGSRQLCTIGFLQLPQGRRPDFNLPYEWKISAYDSTETKLGVSPTWKFKTAQKTVAPPGEPPPGTPPPLGPPAEIKNPISSQTLPELLENALNFLFGLAIVMLPIIIIYGGILLLGSGGDPAKVSQGKTILLWAVIAFAIILVARGLPPILRGLL